MNRADSPESTREDPAEVSAARLRRFEIREIAQHLLLAAWGQRFPVVRGLGIVDHSLLEPRGHAMLGTVTIARVKIDLHLHTITYVGAGRVAHSAVQVEIEVAVPHRHHVDTPGMHRFAIDAQEDRQRPAPSRLDRTRSGSADEDERVDTADPDCRGECGGGHQD
jgi:hypothetical protein